MMFNGAECDFCGDCLARCPYLDFDQGEGKEAWRKLVSGQDSPWLLKCITCFGCNEYCPRGARPFDLILLRLEERGDYVDPKLLEALKLRFEPAGEFKPPAVTGPVMSLCTMAPIVPWAFSGMLFAGLSLVKGRHFFCNVLFSHLGNETIMREGLKPLCERYASLGAEEIIFFHDDCYSLFTYCAPQYGISVPFRPVHLFEYLLQFFRTLKGQIRPLGMKIAYQRPCASRLTPEKEALLDELFSLLGVTRVARRFDREGALCCGQALKGFLKRGEKYPAYQRENIQDALDHGAEAMVFLCPMCLTALLGPCREGGIRTLMITDLCRLALGEELPADAYQLPS